MQTCVFPGRQETNKVKKKKTQDRACASKQVGIHDTLRLPSPSLPFSPLITPAPIRIASPNPNPRNSRLPPVSNSTLRPHHKPKPPNPCSSSPSFPLHASSLSLSHTHTHTPKYSPRLLASKPPPPA
ncbi:hypothetical protein COCMIDRAFT_82848 [Bipolaris oryzae ATCC 44560]|uniref:Uncharacterized protein n=1 Tax=Bipolaris oryzae ATCC 44560 TaxID=930090 RepID=W6ZE04_COCMI|nr:uncharacterized protein COCMIDRAFT_82848 [Bipolaris oryzae ATCC 44560]EUC50092.1 hypothetical protein COCMIDRAFT_82848 [Bipolaris oryzae ATCC 44560]